jgi:multimeric flavodoxin WrbA
MKIIVLNGSPKGIKSVTMQYVRYIREKHPLHELNILNISQNIKKIEKNDDKFQSILENIRGAEGILWATPVYYWLVPANYKRFIELIFEKGAGYVFNGKYTGVLTTSIHFFDHTAHNYLHAICDDLNMKYIGSYSADMYDLLKTAERERFETFFANFFSEIESKTAPPKSFRPLEFRDFQYHPSNHSARADLGKKNLLILTDSLDKQTNLGKMIERFKRCFTNDVEVINIDKLDIKGYCLGCLQCAYDNHCVYEGKDDYNDVFKNKVMKADILVYAGTIRDRYLSSRWKMFFDRSFFKGHVPSLSNKQIGLIISGPLSQVPNIRQILEAYFEMQRTNLVDIVTDEYGDSSQVDEVLESFSNRIIHHSNSMYVGAPTFLSVAGTKLFRDEIWGRLRFPFRADFMQYKRIGVFDFPHKNWKSRIQNTIMLFLSRSSKFRKEANKRMQDEMIKPFEKIF